MFITLCIAPVIASTIESQKINKCSSAFQSLALAVEKYSEIMRDTKYEKSNGYTDPIEMMYNMRDRISHEDPQAVLAVISDTKAASNTREVTLDLLADVLFAKDPVKHKYTNEEVIKTLIPIAFDRKNNNRMRGPAISILCLIYSEINIPHIYSFFLHKLRKMLFDKNESDYIKRQIVYGLKLFQDSIVTRVMEDIIIDGKESETLQIDAMYILAESKTVDPTIINVLMARLLKIQNPDPERLLNMIRAIVDTLYALTHLHEDYKPAVEELINRFFFGMHGASPAATILRVNIIPPVEWSLDSSHVYDSQTNFFFVRSKDPFIDTVTFLKRIRNRTFLTLEYSHNLSMAHILYFLLLNKKEDNTLRMRVLSRLYTEKHPLLPYILAGMIVDTKEIDMIKFASITMIEDAALDGVFLSPRYFQKFLNIQAMIELSEFETANNQGKVSANTQSKKNGEIGELDFQKAHERLLIQLRSSKSNDPVQQEFLRAVSQPELIKQKLSDFISDSENKDSIMKGLMVYALNEWGMLSNTELAEIAMNKGVMDYHIRLMAIKKLVDNLTELKQSSSQSVNASIVENLVKIFTDPFEDPSIRELSAEALFQIQPPALEIQQRLITTLSNETDVIVQDVIHHFQWIKNLPAGLRPSDNVRKIK